MKRLTEQVVTRIDHDLNEWLEWDARENGRTKAQTIRFHLAKARERAREE